MPPTFHKPPRPALACALLLALATFPAAANPEQPSAPARTGSWPLRVSNLLRTGILGLLAVTALPQAAAAELPRAQDDPAAPWLPQAALGVNLEWLRLNPGVVQEALASAMREMEAATVREARKMEAYRLGQLERHLEAVTCRGRVDLEDRQLQVTLEWQAPGSVPGSLQIRDAQGELLDGRIHALEVLDWSAQDSSAERIGFWGTEAGAEARPFSGTLCWKDETFSLALEKGARLAGFPATAMALNLSIQNLQDREP